MSRRGQGPGNLCATLRIEGCQDNANVLSAMVKGSSGNPVVDRMSIIVSLASAYLRTRVWFEYIESDSNWADGASRKLLEDDWSVSHGCKLTQFLGLFWRKHQNFWTSLRRI